MSDVRRIMAQVASLSSEELLYLQARLRDLLGEDPDPDIGVREPRHPRPESGEGAIALVEDDEE